VSLSTRTEGADIYFTLNGDQPTPQSSLYSTPILVKGDTYIRAITVKAGIAYSFIVGSIYAVNP
jgi:uncharacterized protein